MRKRPGVLESIIQALAERSREAGLEINPEKTKLMTNSIAVDVTIDGQKLEYVYLGHIIPPSDLILKEVMKSRLLRMNTMHHLWLRNLGSTDQDSPEKLFQDVREPWRRAC